jgi:hypothetical protein
MRRLEKQLFALTDDIARLRETIHQTDEELRIHQHLDDDAVRDAAVGGPIEREDARETNRDVARFKKLLGELRNRMTRLESKRDQLLSRLGSSPDI